jgi:HTH-type transcriptional regulator/antitoxin HipB
MIINRPEDIGALVRDRRKTLSLSQAELAKRLQVSQRYISHLEGGKPTLQLGLVLRVLRELGIDLSVGFPAKTTQPRKRSKIKPIDIDSLVDD